MTYKELNNEVIECRDRLTYLTNIRTSVEVKHTELSNEAIIVFGGTSTGVRVKFDFNLYNGDTSIAIDDCSVLILFRIDDKTFVDVEDNIIDPISSLVSSKYSLNHTTAMTLRGISRDKSETVHIVREDDGDRYLSSKVYLAAAISLDLLHEKYKRIVNK